MSRLFATKTNVMILHVTTPASCAISSSTKVLQRRREGFSTDQTYNTQILSKATIIHEAASPANIEKSLEIK